MKTTFLGQGLESSSVNAVGHYLIDYLNREDFHSFTGISAFASEAGVFGLSGHIQFARQHYKNLTFIVGIDQNGTSKEALYELLNLDINSYIFYQAEAPIFHPKIYLFEGNHYIKIIIGSSNITGRGLFTNVEGSVLIEFEANDEDGLAWLAEFKLYYKKLFDFSDPNLFRIDSETIAGFAAKGLVPNEAARKSVYSKQPDVNPASSSFNERLAIPKRTVARLPSLFLTKKRASLIKPENASGGKIIKKLIGPIEFLPGEFNIAEIEEDLLVWESGPLTKRDLNIPTGGKTNATGSMLFKKGKMENIDQRHHFRNNVFSSLPWVSDNDPAKSHLERATAFFHIIIEDVYWGAYALMITHNAKTDSKTYQQNNSMTSLSWGKAKVIIASENLIGKEIKLYKNEGEGLTSYIISIH